MMDLTVLEETLALDLGRASNALICLETTHNLSDGAILPLPYLHAIREIANARRARSPWWRAALQRLGRLNERHQRSPATST